MHQAESRVQASCNQYLRIVTTAIRARYPPTQLASIQTSAAGDAVGLDTVARSPRARPDHVHYGTYVQSTCMSKACPRLLGACTVCQDRQGGGATCASVVPPRSTLPSIPGLGTFKAAGWVGWQPAHPCRPDADRVRPSPVSCRVSWAGQTADACAPATSGTILARDQPPDDRPCRRS
jgi:hypothetical protein